MAKFQNTITPLLSKLNSYRKIAKVLTISHISPKSALKGL
jgi:hypothetical protein